MDEAPELEAYLNEIYRINASERIWEVQELLEGDLTPKEILEKVTKEFSIAIKTVPQSLRIILTGKRNSLDGDEESNSPRARRRKSIADRKNKEKKDDVDASQLSRKERKKLTRLNTSVNSSSNLDEVSPRRKSTSTKKVNLDLPEIQEEPSEVMTPRIPPADEHAKAGDAAARSPRALRKERSQTFDLHDMGSDCRTLTLREWTTREVGFRTRKVGEWDDIGFSTRKIDDLLVVTNVKPACLFHKWLFPGDVIISINDKKDYDPEDIDDLHGVIKIRKVSDVLQGLQVSDDLANDVFKVVHELRRAKDDDFANASTPEIVSEVRKIEQKLSEIIQHPKIQRGDRERKPEKIKVTKPPRKAHRAESDSTNSDEEEPERKKKPKLKRKKSLKKSKKSKKKRSLKRQRSRSRKHIPDEDVDSLVQDVRAGGVLESIRKSLSGVNQSNGDDALLQKLGNMVDAKIRASFHEVSPQLPPVLYTEDNYREAEQREKQIEGIRQALQESKTKITVLKDLQQDGMSPHVTAALMKEQQTYDTLSHLLLDIIQSTTSPRTARSEMLTVRSNELPLAPPLTARSNEFSLPPARRSIGRAHSYSNLGAPASGRMLRRQATSNSYLAPNNDVYQREVQMNDIMNDFNEAQQDHEQSQLNMLHDTITHLQERLRAVEGQTGQQYQSPPFAQQPPPFAQNQNALPPIPPGSNASLENVFRQARSHASPTANYQRDRNKAMQQRIPQQHRYSYPDSNLSGENSFASQTMIPARSPEQHGLSVPGSVHPHSTMPRSSNSPSPSAVEIPTRKSAVITQVQNQAAITILSPGPDQRENTKSFNVDNAKGFFYRSTGQYQDAVTAMRQLAPEMVGPQYLEPEISPRQGCHPITREFTGSSTSSEEPKEERKNPYSRPTNPEYNPSEKNSMIAARFLSKQQSAPDMRGPNTRVPKLLQSQSFQTPGTPSYHPSQGSQSAAQYLLSRKSTGEGVYDYSPWNKMFESPDFEIFE